MNIQWYWVEKKFRSFFAMKQNGIIRTIIVENP